MAEANVGIGGYDVAAFLSHQAVEKLLKAVFAAEGRRIPRTHHIDELANSLSLDRELVDDVAELTADYTLARYPDVSQSVPYEEYTEEIAVDRVERAKRLFQSVLGRLEGVV